MDEAIYALDQDLGMREGAQVFASLAIYLELNKRGRLRTVAETALFRRHGADIPYESSSAQFDDAYWEERALRLT
jgi:hypothetical protein